MTIVPYPGDPRHQSVALQPVASARVNVSALSGARQALDMGYSWWTAEVSVAPMKMDNARSFRLFFGRCRGPVNPFRLPVTGDSQHDGFFTVRAQGPGAGYSLVTDGWPPSATTLLAGDYVTVGDQLMVLDEDATANASGVATLAFHSPLRGTVADNTVVETKDPYMLAYLPEGSPALTLTLAHLQAGFSFTAMEAY